MARKREWLLLGLLLAVLFAVQSAVVYRYLAAPRPGANDFYSRWAGARALLLDNRDPYDLSVTREIQTVIRVNPEQVGRGGFHYPLHVLFLFWPLVYLPYTWAQAIWQTGLHWLAMATALLLLKKTEWRPSSLGLAGLLLAVTFLYPVARTILLGQFTLHVTFFLAATLWALQKKREGLAGVLLAGASIKPQIIILPALFLAIWAIHRRRWRFIVGTLTSGAALLLASLLIFPRWPLSFIEDTLRYAQVAGGRNPLAVLTAVTWPGGPPALHYFLAVPLLIAMLYAWWRGLHHEGELFERAVYWSIVIGLIVPFQTGTTNQALLLIPLLAWLRQVAAHGGRWAAIVAPLTLHISLWVLFLSTISGDYENQVLFLPLPFLSLAVLVVLEIRLWRQMGGPAAVSSASQV